MLRGRETVSAKAKFEKSRREAVTQMKIAFVVLVIAFLFNAGAQIQGCDRDPPTIAPISHARATWLTE
jgi:hypothetical protein